MRNGDDEVSIPLDMFEHMVSSLAYHGVCPGDDAFPCRYEYFETEEGIRIPSDICRLCWIEQAMLK